MAATTAGGVIVVHPLKRAFREALYAGVISFGLFVLLIGLKTDQNIRNELVLIQRWGALAAIVLLVMTGRFVYVGFIHPALERRKAVASSAQHGAVVPGFIARNSSSIGITMLFLFPIVSVMAFGFQGSLKWVDNFGIQILIYVMLGWGLNIVIGLAGLLDLGYVAFYAVGAYAYALLGTHYGLSFWILLPCAGIMAATWGVMLGFPVLRLRGDYLAIVTLAFGEIIRLVLINWREVTNGAAGLSGIPKVSFFGLATFNVGDANYIGKLLHLAPSGAYYKIFLYYLILLLCLLTAFVTIRLRRLPVGRAWEALREDEIACRSLGINTTTTKLTAFATGAMFAGFAGSFFAARQGFVSPESFVYLESAIVLAIVVLGGMGSLGGIAVAAFVMIGGTEILRELSFLKVIFGSDFTPELYRMLLFGIAMVVVMLWKPRGFVGSREPTAFLKERKSVSGSFTKEGHG
ncbi:MULTISPECIES: high-affinity branched-chain amino acid ABC transporter permease LivM [unclassified Mesorhizobium]|uniref:high-affinity branched-chain amino acid ABC transporter permease LivM n=1 Tax=unclassified Mesorhizobium TaxID=325217 RepID=UPI00241559B8|nr:MULTISPECIES: high-affinity branched-chain amino acid ABC transporter permease LivM [unclassified Mesorhizobium]MDG4890092.1 high-affinity branched-chain amino acid ABC transporter permease LivM [Mesorhizobium sp. WSM4887]MDG4904234.1 high-affinity branched-chain amino acid ABC transporter permease LivM [Mesorhizobium sp. WSM4962]MDG4909261.1 high-affinity branched-chain amino acid ABC transporter permease LivM [Mesorhizobium sp. WSM4898]MDG4921885.1 high-affinity branched-chain amino acid A